MARNDWRHRAACRNLDPEIFFPVAEDGPVRDRETARAKAVCARCPVAAQCLAWALESGQDYGIWGGMTEDERRALRRPASREGSADSAPRPRPDPSPLAGRSRKGARVRAEGIETLLDGATPQEVADEFGVNLRTVERWAARPEVRAVRPRQDRRDPLSRRSLARAGA
jgi:WhiB family redox-sensing transcriptional regulator